MMYHKHDIGAEPKTCTTNFLSSVTGQGVAHTSVLFFLFFWVFLCVFAVVEIVNFGSFVFFGFMCENHQIPNYASALGARL